MTPLRIVSTLDKISYSAPCYSLVLKVRINFLKLYREKLNSKNLRVTWKTIMIEPDRQKTL